MLLEFCINAHIGAQLFGMQRAGLSCCGGAFLLAALPYIYGNFLLPYMGDGAVLEFKLIVSVASII